MMNKTYFNEKLEAVINVDLYPVKANLKDGEMGKFKQHANTIFFFQKNKQGTYYKIGLMCDDIKDLLLQINNIESNEIEAKCDLELPF